MCANSVKSTSSAKSKNSADPAFTIDKDNSSDYSKTIRLTAIIDLLNRRTAYGGITCRELAERTAVSERQIYRDLRTLQDELHIALQKEGKPVRFKLDSTYLPPISPEKTTVILLSLLQQKGSALSGHIETIKNTLISHLFKQKYKTGSETLQKLQKRIYVVEEALVNAGKVGELFTKLLDAVNNEYRIKIWYYVISRGEKTERVVEPYGLICKRQHWYLVGNCHLSKSIRTFRVDQIEDIFPYAFEKFIYPQDFLLDNYIGDAWGVINDHQSCRVLMKFKKEVAHRVKNVLYHPSQKVEKELPDGSVVLSFKTSGMPELVSWVIRWGNKVEVLEPPLLKEKVKQEVAKILEMYE